MADLYNSIKNNFVSQHFQIKEYSTLFYKVSITIKRVTDKTIDHQTHSKLPLNKTTWYSVTVNRPVTNSNKTYDVITGGQSPEV